MSQDFCKCTPTQEPWYGYIKSLLVFTMDTPAVPVYLYTAVPITKQITHTWFMQIWWRIYTTQLCTDGEIRFAYTSTTARTYLIIVEQRQLGARSNVKRIRGARMSHIVNAGGHHGGKEIEVLCDVLTKAS